MTKTQKKNRADGFNPLRIRRNDILKLGLMPRQTDPDFFQFRSPAWGYRAGFVMLRVCRHRFRIRTIRQLAEYWRVHRDLEEQEIYIRQLAVLTGMGPEEPIDGRRPEQLVGLVRALNRVEQGDGPENTGELRQGWQMYLG